MFLVYLIYLLLLDTHIDNMIYNRKIGACFETTYEFLFNNSIFSSLKYAITIPLVNDALFPLSALD